MRTFLIACEFSGIVRDAFLSRGLHAVSCDLLETESPSDLHIVGDVRDIDTSEFFAVISFPPCTHLASSGARWFHMKQNEQADAVEFARWLMDCSKRTCVENPVGVLSTKVRKPDQIINPWMFGHGERKATCLWLKGLPLLKETNVVSGRYARVHREPPSPERWKNRSRTYQGIADAMADQWGRV